MEYKIDKESGLIIHSSDYIEGSEVCSSYKDGKCLDSDGKYCDGCYSNCIEQGIEL